MYCFNNLLAQRFARVVRKDLVMESIRNPNTVARTRELHEKMTNLSIPCELIVVPGVKHSYRNLYAELGDKEFQFYKALSEKVDSNRSKGGEGSGTQCEQETTD